MTNIMKLLACCAVAAALAMLIGGCCLPTPKIPIECGNTCQDYLCQPR